MGTRHENGLRRRRSEHFHSTLADDVADDLNRHWHDRPDPMEAPLRLVREAGKWALIILVALAAVIILGLAFLDGLARAEGRPALCDGLRGAECAAAVAEVWQ